jgi:peroxiredoxin
MDTQTHKKNKGLTAIEKLKALDWKDKNLLLLVRHRGCTFCRETLQNMSHYLKDIQAKGYQVYVVHMGPEESSHKLARDFNLDQVHMISDPEKEIFKALGARRGSFKEVLGLKVFKKGLLGGSLMKHGVGPLEGDGFQLGGLYRVHNDQVECLHRPEHAGDLEPWDQILQQLS